MKTAHAPSVARLHVRQQDVHTSRMERSLHSFVKGAWSELEGETPFVDGWHIGFMCEVAQAILPHRHLRNVIINVPPRHMKPVHAEELVQMADGSRLRAGSVCVGQKVTSHTGRACRVSAVHKQGVLPLLEVSTFSGRSVRTAGDHPFLTPTGWVQAQHLQEGDVLGAVVPQVTVRGSASNEACRLAGYLVGDGNVTNNPRVGGHATQQCNVTCLDPVQGADIVHCVKTLGFEGSLSVITRARGRYNLSGGVRDWVREIGLAGQTSHTKRVPAFVFAEGVEGAAQFLGAYFACDGTMSKKGGARRDMIVNFNSVSRVLLLDVQALLLRLGIRSRVRTHAVKYNSFAKGPHTSYVLSVASQDDTAKFVERVPVKGVKQERLRAWGIRRTRFEETLHPDPVVSVKSAGEGECVCFTVEKDSSFTISGLAVHNSLTFTVFWQAWLWGPANQPHLRMLNSSFAAPLSMRDSTKVRRLIASPWYQARWGHRFRMMPDQDTKSRFDNSATGFRFATSTGGPATGEGGHLLNVDDAQKAGEALSENKRESMKEWWRTTWSSRLNDKATGCRVVTGQRLHQQDIVGVIDEQIQEAEAEGVDLGWTRVVVPARYEGHRCTVVLPGKTLTDPREIVGTPMWPEKMPDRELRKLELELGPFGTAGQLQQRPSPEQGGIFPRGIFQRWKVRPERFTRIFHSWDASFKEGANNSYVVCIVAGEVDGKLYVLRRVRRRMGWAETRDRVMAEHLRTKADHGRAPDVTLVEEKANGSAILSEWDKLIPGMEPVNPGSDSKSARANAAAPHVAAGLVLIPDEWSDAEHKEWEDEFADFPNAAHDDQVDGLSQLVIWWRNGERPVTAGPAAPPMDDDAPVRGKWDFAREQNR